MRVLVIGAGRMGAIRVEDLVADPERELTRICDFVDLDAPLLIANDPYEGVRYEGSMLSLPDRPGIGVLPRAEIL